MMAACALSPTGLLPQIAKELCSRYEAFTCSRFPAFLRDVTQYWPLIASQHSLGGRPVTCGLPQMTIGALSHIIAVTPAAALI